MFSKITLEVFTPSLFSACLNMQKYSAFAPDGP